jgi:hypothetical protein
MNWKTCANRGALCAVLFLALTAAKCDDQGVTARYALEKVPDEYRTCFAKIVDVKAYETGGKIAWKDAQRLIVDLRASELRLQRCGKSAVAWVDAQHAALNRYLGQ